MRKLRYAVILPMVQVALAAILLNAASPQGDFIPTSKLICLGLNAPAQLFMLLAPPLWGEASGWFPASILGFDTSYAFFLVGVIVVWFFVGRALDRKLMGERHIGSWLSQISLMALGFLLLLLYVGPEMRTPRYGGNEIRPEDAILTILWSACLMFVSGRGLVNAMRRALNPNYPSH